MRLQSNIAIIDPQPTHTKISVPENSANIFSYFVNFFY